MNGINNPGDLISGIVWLFSLLLFDPELCFVQFLIGAAGPDQIPVLSALNNFPVPDHENLVRGQNGGQTMSDQNAGPAGGYCFAPGRGKPNPTLFCDIRLRKGSYCVE
jgi:hypothetical protein